MSNSQHNSLPSTGPGSMSPIGLLTGSPVWPNIKHYAIFGCPSYVLNNNLQAQRKINKWISRARVGVYLGKSPQHARSVSLVLNPDTGLISLQYHIKFDTGFATLDPPDRQVLSSAKWLTLCSFQREAPNNAAISNNAQREVPTMQPFIPNGISPTDTDKTAHTNTGSNIPSEDYSVATDADTRSLESTQTHITADSSIHNRQGTIDHRLGSQSKAIISQPNTTRLCKQIKPPPWLNEYDRSCLSMHECPEPPWWVGMAASSDPDILYYHEAMMQSDNAQFIKAMCNKVMDHVNKKHWHIIHKTKMVPGGKALPLVWALHHKRCIDTQEVYKWKARLNIDGSHQIYGDTYWHMYSPVASWGAIRLVLVSMLSC
jgi:hypothetical protein